MTKAKLFFFITAYFANISIILQKSTKKKLAYPPTKKNYGSAAKLLSVEFKEFSFPFLAQRVYKGPM